MTQPPQSGPWGAHPPQQPGNWQGYPGGQHGPGPQGQWNPQQQWPNPAPAPQKKGPLKWVLGAIALIAVIAVTAVVAVSCAGGNGSNNGGGGNTPSSGSKSDIASANDTGPVSVIIEDPSCAPWQPINDTLANSVKNGWDKRDPSVPATGWTPETRALYQSAAEAFRKSADQTVPLIKLTPHRVMRELYQQYIAYIRAFVDHVPNYTPNDNYLVSTATIIGMALTNICQAAKSGSAAARGPLVASAPSPSKIAPIGDPDKPVRFLMESDQGCSDWTTILDRLQADPAYEKWNKEDTNIPASDWPPEYRAENDAIKSVLTRISEEMTQLGHKSANPIIEDFAVLAAQYSRAYVEGIPTYTSADTDLYNVFWRVSGAISSACKATGAS
ncbi:hypothetical protein MTY66_59660 [Mycolicibacterium sp. TY66]|uniref:hypothetical protein n=1 Tax=unclassified Mycolicibacterium TaxID=2636767 RepID=UPI001BB3EB8A|nr:MULTISPECIES: hypothetical protein [unclassified Mycolicibacterium]BCI84341.1 hypothetical protein MTY66_59660 [Mycolicibacterium sp. TY66]BCJ84037.1 hypothetical protein MTY81_54100 [Mycolicibacterium sp. TY81]